MRPTKQFTDKERLDIRKDFKNGLSYRELANKYHVSTTKIRSELGNQVVKVKTKKQVTEKTKLKKSIRKDFNHKKLVEIQAESVKNIVIGDYIDVFEGIRQSTKDMLDLNEEQKHSLKEMVDSLKIVVDYINANADFKDTIRPAAFKAFAILNDYWGRGKLRIESRKELGNWFDRYKEFNMIALQFNFYENVIKSLFEGINTLDAADYLKLKNTAIGIFGATERFFTQNEEQSADKQ